MLQPLPPKGMKIRVVRRLGKGGLGTVEEVEVLESNGGYPVGSRWARKQLNEEWNKHPEARERFEREISTLKSMNHPCIVAFRGENLEPSKRFYLMPLYPLSLRDFIQANPQGRSWREVANFALPLVDALAYAHNKGFFHRDLKPENILLTQENSAILSDWGLGYFVHKHSKVLDLTHGGLGTEYYCSPEQWATGKCDQRGDIYSLGMTLAEIIEGKRNPALAFLGIRHDVVPPASGGAQELNKLLREMTSPHKELRPWSMQVVHQRLSSLRFLS